MAEGCDCTSFGKNTGLPNCKKGPNGTRQLILAPVFKSNGERFSIPVGEEFDQDFLDSLVNAENPRDRIYPVPGLMQTVTNTRSESVFKEYDAGTKRFIREGARDFAAVILDIALPAFKGQIEGFGCVEMGIYSIDNSGNWRGTQDANLTVLYPTRIAQGTLEMLYVEADAESPSEFAISFQFADTELDKYLNMFPAASIEADLSLVKGLVDVTSTAIGTVTTTELVVDLNLIYGDAADGYAKFTGADTSNIDLLNLTNNTVVTIDSITENPDGTYTIDYTNDAQTIGDFITPASKATLGVLDTPGYELTKTSIEITA